MVYMVLVGQTTSAVFYVTYAYRKVKRFWRGQRPLGEMRPLLDYVPILGSNPKSNRMLRARSSNMGMTMSQVRYCGSVVVGY